MVDLYLSILKAEGKDAEDIKKEQLDKTKDETCKPDMVEKATQIERYVFEKEFEVQTQKIKSEYAATQTKNEKLQYTTQEVQTDFDEYTHSIRVPEEKKLSINNKSLHPSNNCIENNKSAITPSNFDFLEEQKTSNRSGVKLKPSLTGSDPKEIFFSYVIKLLIISNRLR